LDSTLDESVSFPLVEKKRSLGITLHSQRRAALAGVRYVVTC